MKKISTGLIFIIPFLVSACLNQGTQTSGSGGTATTAKATATTGTTTSSASFTMSKVVATPPANTSTPNATPEFSLIFDANNLSNTLNDVCRVQTTGSNNDPGKACSCRYVWSATNLSNSSLITRTVDTSPTQITSFQVNCPGPDVYYNDTEIPPGTNIKIQLVPDTRTSTVLFTTNAINFPKQAITATGDFRDAEGHAFRNVFHYSCFDKLSKNLKIEHELKVAGQNQQTSAQIKLPVANGFKSSGGAGVTSYSGQSYFYDFYVRSNEIGTINTGNSFFTCPQVNINGSPSFYPMDSQFAVALQTSTNFPVPVNAQTVVPLGNGSSSSGIVGYAARPNSDQSCPVFTDSTGKVRRTFRIRKLTAIYPLRFNSDGSVNDTSQRSNTIYVMDRPVDKLGQDPLKPITRLGPKPCPFSFKTAQFGQKCMSDASLAGWNIDGTQIDGNAGCPIYPPVPSSLLKSDGTLVIRPYQPFVAHYLEDTTFKACAFPSSTPVDPEIVISHDDNIFPGAPGPRDFYCAKYYPAAGLAIPPPGGDPFDKPPGACDLAASAAAIKTDKSYSCLRTFDPTNATLSTPSAGCCQICSGANCTAAGGGTLAPGRNAAFSPPANTGNPAQAIKQLPRATPNVAGGGGCFDPYED